MVNWLKRRTTSTELLQVGKIPDGCMGCKNSLFFGNDSEENCLRNPHQRYGKDSITYEFNKQGFRCGEFDEEADVRVIVIGCSVAFGSGLPRQDTFGEQFAERLRAWSGLRVNVWNLSMCGESNDYIFRVLSQIKPLLQPADIVLVLFTYLCRREYMAVDGTRVPFIGGRVQPNIPVPEMVFDCLSGLSSDHDNHLNFYRNFVGVRELLRDTRWLFSMCDTLPRVRALVQADPHYVGPIEWKDKARDHGHPGYLTHRTLCDKFWADFLEMKVA
jgi:hypothetical protein